MNTCYIIGAGEADKIDIKKDETDFIICADGGFAYAEKNSIVPDLMVGDFDSLGRVPNEKNVLVHPAEKDETDSLLAINCGLERGYKNFVMFGMLGGRLDHTYANIQHLVYLCENGASGTLIGCGHKVTAIKNSRLSFDKKESGMISVFSFLPESKGVTLGGLKYLLNDYTMKSALPIGVSNEFLGKDAFVEVRDGVLIIIWENKI
ncbi:MAG: thiamine diphosphokinase [Ruminococcus sp.]|nr:thiamine diphosphokinase [Ruminococcus sp.]